MRQFLVAHEVSTAYELGWATIKNGELLEAAEEKGFALLVTTDTQLMYQQNLNRRRIAIVVLTTTNWPRIKDAAPDVVRAVNACDSGDYVEVRIP